MLEGAQTPPVRADAASRDLVGEYATSLAQGQVSDSVTIGDDPRPNAHRAGDQC